MTLLCSASFLYGALFYAKYIAISESVAATHLGLIGTFLSIVMTASPLVTLVCIFIISISLPCLQQVNEEIFQHLEICRILLVTINLKD